MIREVSASGVRGRQWVVLVGRGGRIIWRCWWRWRRLASGGEHSRASHTQEHHTLKSFTASAYLLQPSSQHKAPATRFWR